MMSGTLANGDKIDLICSFYTGKGHSIDTCYSMYPALKAKHTANRLAPNSSSTSTIRIAKLIRLRMHGSLMTHLDNLNSVGQSLTANIALLLNVMLPSPQLELEAINALLGRSSWSLW